MIEKEWIVKICKERGDTKESLFEFLCKVAERNSYQEKYLKIAMEDITEDEADRLEALICYYCKDGSTVKEIVQKYLNLIDYIMEEQIYFIKNDRYRCSSFEEVENLYKDTTYMDSYVVGLGLSTYLWSIHRGILRFFIEKCRLVNKGWGYLEIGPGHGEYFVAAMQNTEFDSYLAIDISKSSVEMTRDYSNYRIKKEKNYEVLCKNFFDFTAENQYNAVVMGEVLEHVEDPLRFLKKIYDTARDDAFIFISTAINAPQPDHIYHFHNIQEVRDLYEKANLKVKDQIVLTANNVSIEKALKKKHTILIGNVLTK